MFHYCVSAFFSPFLLASFFLIRYCAGGVQPRIQPLVAYDISSTLLFSARKKEYPSVSPKYT